MSVPENSLSDQERLIQALLAQAESNNRLANAVAQLAAAIADEADAGAMDGPGEFYLDGTPK